MSEPPFRTVLIASSWRTGSTALNVSLVRHPAIFGWEYEVGFFHGVAVLAERLERFAPDRVAEIIPRLFAEFCRLSGWNGEHWVVHKDPQDSRRIGQVAEWSAASRVILLVRNPYAIVHSLLDHLKNPPREGPPREASPREACYHVNSYYERLLDFEARRPELVYRVRYEELACHTNEALGKVLREVFQLPFDQHCLEFGRIIIPKGYGDQKIGRTTTWDPTAEDAWRVGLSKEEKRYVKTNCRQLFTLLKYDPDDVQPRPRSDDLT